MTKKRWMTMVLAFTLIFALLAGCGGNNNPTTADPTPSTTPPATTPAKNDGGSKSDDSKLTGEFEIQYFVGGYGDAFWKQAIAEFQAMHPDLKIKESAGSQINDQMRPRWISGDPPDFVYIDGAGSNTSQMVSDDQLMDITDWLRDAKNADGNSILDVLIAQPEEYVEGKFHAVPFVFGSWGTFYDKKLFADNGWGEPEDWESFIAVGEKIKAESDMSVYVHTGVYPYYINGALLDPAILAMNDYDTSIIHRINRLEEGVWRSEAVVKALDRFVEMRDKGFFDPGSVALNHTDSQMQWLQHKSAFIPTGIWVEGEMADDIPNDFEFGFVPSIGQEKGGKFVANPYVSTVAIAKRAKNPEAAKAFLQHIFSEQQAIAWAELSKAPSNIKADLEGSNATALTIEANRYYSSDNTVVSPEVVIPEDLVTERNHATVALTIGEITPEQWIERMEEATARVR